MNLKKCEVKSLSADDTEKIAEKIGNRLMGGEVIELISDLGGGKTTFVRGLARGMGSPDHVSSPTFKISNTYKTDNISLQHFDLYRLNEAGIVADELIEEIGRADSTAVIEWGAVVQNVLPKARLTISIVTTGNTERQLALSYPDKLSYLISDVC